MTVSDEVGLVSSSEFEQVVSHAKEPRNDGIYFGALTIHGRRN